MITYTTKVATNPLPNVPANWVADNANEIKTVVNANETTLDNHVANTSNPHSVTASQVGLGNVDNTSDAGKPVSTAQQTALDLKKPLPVSESFTETITFDARNKFSSTTQTGAIAIALAGSGHLDNSDYQMVINGNSTHAITISSAFNVSGVLDNTKKNIIFFKYISSSVKPLAVIYTEALVSFINDYSLSISPSTPNNSMSISDAGGELDFTNGSGTDEAGSFFCWIKLGAIGINQCIMSRGDGGSNAYIQFIIGTDNKLVVYFTTAGSNYIGKQQSTATLVAGIWTHVGFTKSTVEAHTAIIIYVNGLSVALTNVSAGSYTGVAAGGTTKIGHQNITAGVTGNYLVDDAFFANKELSAAEVIEAYNGGYVFDKRTASFTSNVKAYYGFEQTGNDLTANGHNGTIVTAVYSTSHP